VTSSSQPSSYTLFQQLHWFPVEYRINFATANITFRSLNSSQPACVYSSLRVHYSTFSTRSLRLSNINLLSVPFVRTSFGAATSALQLLKVGTRFLRLFECVSAPDTFRRHLKIHHFQRPSSPLNAFLLAPHFRLMLIADHCACL